MTNPAPTIASLPKEVLERIFDLILKGQKAWTIGQSEEWPKRYLTDRHLKELKKVGCRLVFGRRRTLSCPEQSKYAQFVKSGMI